MQGPNKRMTSNMARTILIHTADMFCDNNNIRPMECSMPRYGVRVMDTNSLRAKIVVVIGTVPGYRPGLRVAARKYCTGPSPQPSKVNEP